MNEKTNNRRLALIWAVIILVTCVFLVLWILEGETGGVTITPLEQDEEGIAPNTEFLVEARNGSKSRDALLASISLDPSIPFSFETHGENSYDILLSRALLPKEELTITVGSHSQTFTARNELVVTSHSPTQGNVPLNSGIEFIFNTINIPLTRFIGAFSITPEVEGNFESGGGRFVFYPTEGFEPDTSYTAKVSGLTLEDGASLRENSEVTFTTAKPILSDGLKAFQFQGNGVSVNALGDEPPVFRAYLDPDFGTFNTEDEVAVKVFAYDGWEPYAERLETALGASELADLGIDTSAMPTVAEFAITPIAGATGGDDYYYNRGSWIFQFPETLPKGWYVAEFSFDKNGQTLSRQQLLQVSDTSVFYMWTGENVLAWVNDAATGQPVEGASISLDGGLSATGVTGADGTATIADATEAVAQDYARLGNLLTVTHGDEVFVDLNNYNYYTYGGWSDTDAARRYLSYLYTDRPIYHTTDTIQAWGVARNRDDTAGAHPAKVTLALTNYPLGTLAETEVEVRDDGTFKGELPIEGLKSGWVQLELRIDGEMAYSEYLTLEDYVKPVYTAEAFTDKPVYMPGAGDEESTLTARVSLFDGTPASQFGLELSGDLNTIEADSETDENGVASATLSLRDDLNTWYPQSSWYHFSSTDAQDENLYLSGAVRTIHRDVMLRAQAVPGTRGQSMTVQTNLIDTSRITEEDDLWNVENLAGAAMDLEVKATIHKVYYTKTASGTYYDYINRETRQTWRYDKHDEILDTRTFRTGGGQYRLDDLPVNDDDVCYYAYLTCTDTQGRLVEYTLYLGAIYERWGSGGGTNYELRKDTTEADRQSWEYDGIIQFYWDGSRFRDGEDVGFTLYLNDEPVQEMPGRLLYSLVQDDFGNTAISGAPRVTVPFAEKLLPNYVLAGAYFDGRRVYQLSETRMSFDPEGRRLDISLAPDRDSYAPGDAVSVKASVVDASTGQPAPDVSLVLGVVDEAVFALQEQYINILSNLYRSVYFPELQKYTSDVAAPDAAAGEMGGGGGGYSVRKDFADTATFDTATTGADGGATFSFKLADNITEWRLTSLGVSPTGRAGQTVGNVVATKPFFITPVVNANLLAGDSVAVGLYGAGVAVKSADTTDYTITVKGGGVDETRTASSALRKYATVEFGKLPAGEYTVTVAGKCGDYSDAVQLPFTIRESGVEVSIVKSFELKDGLDVEPLRWPVSVVLYGDGAKTWNMALRALQSGSGGVRADMRLARTYAARVMEGMGERWYDEEALTQDLTDIDGRRLLQLFPYTDSDIELSVKAHLAAPGLVGDGFLSSLSAEGIANSMETSIGAVYLARAMVGEPQASELQTLANNPTATYVDRAYAAMAMAWLGDKDAAQSVYDSLVLPSLVQSTGVSGLSMLAVQAGDAQYTDEQCTGAASMLATMLKTKEAAGLITQLTEKGSKYEPFLLEQMYYLSTFAPGGGNASFTYNLDGKNETVSLDTGVKVVTLTKDQFETANFKTASGTVHADVYYVGGAQQLDTQSEGHRLGLTKTVRPVEGEDFEVGGLVQITLTPDFTGLDTTAGNLLLTIDDYVPSGMRFVRYPYNSDMKGWYLNNREEQRLHFTVYGLYPELELRPIVYYARVTTPGEYVVESAYVSSASADSWGLSERGTVTIE